MSDHAHMLISIPPKYAVSQVVGFIKGKSAIHIARQYSGHKKNFTGQHFWARGYHVSTVKMKRQFVNISRNKNEKIVGRSTQFLQVNCCHLSGGQQFFNRFERFTFFKPPAVPVVRDFSPCQDRRRIKPFLIIKINWLPINYFRHFSCKNQNERV